ncbi:MAG: type II secretion system protein N [Halioglobus sp.]
MPHFRTGIALFVILLVLLTVSAPARLLGQLVSSDVLVIHGFSGSLWRGAAAQCLVRVGHGYLNLGNVKWHLEPMTLLTLSPTIALESHWGAQNISGVLTLRDVEEIDIDIADLDATISAQLLRQYAPLQVEGDIALRAEHVNIRSGMPNSSKGQIVWRNAAWLSSLGSIPLGSYAVDFSQPQDEALIGEIVTISGAVAARGSIELRERDYAVDVFVEADSGLDDQLRQAMSLFAQPEADGYRIVLDGQL